MGPEKEKNFIDFIKLISPGTPLRTVVDDLVRSDLGAMIVFDSPELVSQNMFEGGFRINCRFSPQKLFELCKMDGAIIVSSDLKRILYANVLMTPEKTIHSTETGTRHINAEKVAKQAKTLVITASERRKKTTLFFGSARYYLKSTEELTRHLSSNLQVLEKQRESFDLISNNLSVLEMSELVSVSDVCKLIQRSEMMLKISESIKRNFVELGREGNVMQMRYKELLKNIDRMESEVLRDYSKLSLKKSKTILENFTFEGLLETDSIARLIIEKPLEETISPRGFRFLSHLNLSVKEINQLIKQFGHLNAILSAESPELEVVLKNRAVSIKGEVNSLREQILSGKIIY